MKKLITAGALVIVLASPAFAQKYRGQHSVNPGAAAAYAQANQPARAPQPGQFTGDTGYMGNDRGQIIWGGAARGQDPDPFIRSQISRGLGNYGAD